VKRKASLAADSPRAYVDEKALQARKLAGGRDWIVDGKLGDFPVRVRVVDADRLDGESFDPCVPLIVHGVLDRAQAKWTDDWLLDRFGDDRCQVSLDSRTARRAHETQLPLARFLESMEKADGADDVRAYLFHSSVGSDAAEDLLDDLDIPQPIVDLGVPSLHRFFVGPKFSGTLPHFHTHAVNALSRGRKRWAIYEGKNARVTAALMRKSLRDFGSGSQAYDWFHSECATLRHRPMVRLWEFVQEAGDLVYIPGGLIHAVVNLAPVVGFTVEFEPDVAVLEPIAVGAGQRAARGPWSAGPRLPGPRLAGPRLGVWNPRASRYRGGI
jgi:hypothetical protein